MLIPQCFGRYPTSNDFETLVKQGKGSIDPAQLEKHIPINTLDSWSAGKRIEYGFKFQWINPGDKSRWTVHGHASDSSAPISSNAHKGWIVCIRRNNQRLLAQSHMPPVGTESYWTRNKHKAGETHICLTSEILRLRRRHSFCAQTVTSGLHNSPYDGKMFHGKQNKQMLLQLSELKV